MESETAAVETGASSAESGAKVRKLKRAAKGARRAVKGAKRAPRDAQHTDTTYKRNTPKVGMALTPDVARLVRRLRAQLEMKSGERVTIAKAIEHAVKAIIKK
jgi:hypothetical protein